MQKISNEVKVDFANMTLEDLESSREDLRDTISKVCLDDKQTLVDLRLKLSNLNHQILMRKLVKHKYH